MVVGSLVYRAWFGSFGDRNCVGSEVAANEGNFAIDLVAEKLMSLLFDCA